MLFNASSEINIHKWNMQKLQKTSFKTNEMRWAV